MNSFGETIEWTFNNISPFALSGVLVFAAYLHPITSYLFLASFTAWVVSTLTYFVWIVYSRRWLQIIYDYVGEYIRWVVDRILEMKKFYIVKVVVGVLGSYITAASAYWIYHHFDLWDLIKATWNFLKDIPNYLFDSHLLIEAIHRWINGVFLGSIVRGMSLAWSSTMETIVKTPLTGLLCIIGAIMALVMILFAIQLLRNCTCSNIVEDIANNISPPATNGAYQADNIRRVGTRRRNLDD